MWHRLDHIIVFDGQSAHSYKLSVIELAADSSDLTSKFPVAYKFTKAGSSDDYPLRELVVRVSDDIVDQFGKGSLSLHQIVTRYGIIKLRGRYSTSDVQFLPSQLAEVQDHEDLKGPTLRIELLRLAYASFLNDPQLGLTILDFHDNVFAPKIQIEQWARTLREAGFFVKGSTVTSERERSATFSYRIAANREQEIRTLLSNSSGSEIIVSRRIFLSYSTMDRKLAGRIKTWLQENLNCEVFLAHEDIEPSEEWIVRIESELQACSGLIALLTSHFRESKWTSQELGIAHAYKKPIVQLLCPETPFGFTSKYQGLTIDPEHPEVSLSRSKDILVSRLGFQGKN